MSDKIPDTVSFASLARALVARDNSGLACYCDKCFPVRSRLHAELCRKHQEISCPERASYNLAWAEDERSRMTPVVPPPERKEERKPEPLDPMTKLRNLAWAEIQRLKGELERD